MRDESDVDPGTWVAIIGASGRFPGARTLEEFWTNLRLGVESVKRFTEEELRAAGEAPEVLADPAYVPVFPVFEGMELFDAAFFGMSPRDAAVMDPQHRIFLEIAWEAMEDAGYDPEDTGGPVGVFAACGQNTYMMHHLVTNHEIMETVGEWLVRHTGNDMNFLATRVSYQMNLKGPSLNVQTACSSALTAVHLACQSLNNGECDLALAGASTMLFPQDRGYLHKEGEILSPDGHCRPFDSRSGGTLFGSGAGCVVLKRLADALRDGDRVLGVVRGSAVNNDGAMKVGYLAPSVDGQARAIAEAIAISGVDAESISYIEAHGTATSIGDPIEVEGLTQAFREYTEKRQFCGIGSVKANIGHLGEAAGVASLIKMLLAFEHGELPPSINYEAPNPEIDFAASPVFVNQRLVAWRPPGPRRAGITALGAGGTNVHVVLEEPPTRPTSGASRATQLLVLSARTESALDRATERLAQHLEANPGTPLADVAYTLQVGRKQFSHRRALVAGSAAEAVQILTSRDPKRLFSHASNRSTPSVVFMFPGGGAQYSGAGAELYAQEAVYRAALDECLAAFESGMAANLRRLLLDASGDVAAKNAELERPALSICAVFVIEYAMAKLLLSWGIAPSAMIGHSMGEYVAACLASVMTLEEAAAILTLRGKIFESVAPGGMLSVPLPEAEVRPLLGADLSLAAVNAPGLCVVSGPDAALDAVARTLAARDIESTRLHIAVAAHSAMLDPHLPEFERLCRSIRLRPPQLPFMSNLTGTWIKPEEATDPGYWVRHLRQTVRFSDGVAEVLRGESRVLLEVGPGRTLSSLARQQPSANVTSLPTLRHPQETIPDLAFLLQTVGRLWTHGVRADARRFFAGQARQRVKLPTYPFERQRYWIPRRDALSTAPERKRGAALRKRADVADWFALPSWKRSVSPSPAAPEGTWLVFSDPLGVAEELKRRYPNVILVAPGFDFENRSEIDFMIRPGRPGDYLALLEQLNRLNHFPTQVVHLWGLTKRPLLPLGSESAWSDVSEFEETRTRCFDSLFYLAKALTELELPTTVTAATNDLFSLAGEPTRDPARALVTGPLRVIPRELPQVATRHVDLAIPRGKGVAEAVDALAREISNASPERLVLYRGGQRWVRTYDAVRLESAPASAARTRGTYVITGGLGGIGLEVAAHLAKTRKANLVLLGRSPLPPRPEWDSWVARYGDGDRTSHRIRKIRAIEDLGAQVLAVSADVTDREQMEGAIATARARFGPIHGAVHAAGVLDDGLIALKTRESTSAVIDSKAKGALVLRAALAREPLDFLVVFSSVSSIIGLEGQVDYTAANAFLDALAEHVAASGGGPRVVAVNWNAWQDVGMAVALADRPAEHTPPASMRLGPHPMLARLVTDTESQTEASTPFSRASHWLLSEHVVRGAEALVPGTGYLELARAALEVRREDRDVELSDVFFLSPFSVRVGETRTLSVRLQRTGAGAGEFSFFSEDPDAPHVTGRARYVDRSASVTRDVRAIAARCDRQTKALEGFLDQKFVDFGPRWGNLKSVAYGDREALVTLELPEPYRSDLASFPLHPALLDMATGGAQPIVPGFDQEKDFYVPFSYQRLVMHGPLTARLHSHVRFQGAKQGLISFDVSILDERGTELVSVTGFTMKRVDLAEVLRTQRVGPSEKVTRVGAAVQSGIVPSEGMDALDRILASSVRGQIVASSVDVEEWTQNVEDAARASAGLGAAGAQQEGGGTFERPAALASAYMEPRDEIERELAGLWRELLGVAKVGIQDDFFELGGQSLVAVRLFNKIRKRYGVDLPISTLFDAPTIAECAVILRQELGIELVVAPEANAAPPVGNVDGVAVRDAVVEGAPESAIGGGRQRRWASLVAMQKKGQGRPLYIAAGMGGTLNNLRKLALLLGEQRPVYGLQPPGADGKEERLYRVEDLATHYLEQVRAVQPTGPYFLGGYSGGGVVAFEMARQLEACGERTVFLGFLDSFSPHLPMRSRAARAKIHLERLKDHGASYIIRTVDRRLYHDIAVMKLAMGRQLGKIFPERYRYEALQDSWVVAERNYLPGKWSGKATLFRAREESAISRWTAIDVDAQHGWGRYVTGGVDVVICPGDHTTICEEPYVRTLAQRMREAIERAEEDVKTGGGDAVDPPEVERMIRSPGERAQDGVQLRQASRADE